MSCSERKSPTTPTESVFFILIRSFVPSAKPFAPMMVSDPARFRKDRFMGGGVTHASDAVPRTSEKGMIGKTTNSQPFCILFLLLCCRAKKCLIEIHFSYTLPANRWLLRRGEWWWRDILHIVLIEGVVADGGQLPLNGVVGSTPGGIGLTRRYFAGFVEDSCGRID